MLLGQKIRMNKAWATKAFLSWLVLLLPLVGHAAVVNNLYSDEEPLEHSMTNPQQAAMSKALANTLVKVAGNVSVLNNNVIKQALTQPDKYVLGFSVDTQQTTQGVQNILTANFDEIAIKNLLRSANVAIWGNNRPSTLLWVAVHSNGQRYILRQEQQLATAIRSGFTERGVPLLFPLLDFDDAQNISSVDIWGGFNDKVLQASQRYGVGSVLSGRLTERGGLYYGRLTLLFQQQNYSVDVNQADTAKVANVMANLVASTLSKHYAVGARAQSKTDVTMLRVAGVDSLEDFAALYRFLDQLVAVRSLIVSEVSGNEIMVLLKIDGSEAQFAEALDLERKLARQSANQNDSEAGQPLELRYRWLH